MRRGLVLLLGLVACRPTPSEPHEDAPTPAASSGVSNDDANMSNDDTDTARFDPSAWNGRCVIAEGYAQAQKIGAALNLGGPMLGVVFDEQSQWTVPLGVRVRVKGRIAERADLPVFVQDPNGPIMQGMPVPPDTDLEQARRRWVIERIETTVIRTPEQVEAELAESAGESVELQGVLWSRNGVWWLSHEGVDVHLEQAGTPDFPQHGEAVTARGRLSRRTMPRIDQLGIAEKPELAEAYVLRIDSLGPHPGWALSACDLI
jgi:hypothetical protein